MSVIRDNWVEWGVWEVCWDAGWEVGERAERVEEKRKGKKKTRDGGLLCF